ncbi:hypothetical protein [Pseudomonas fluorescens]|uniref:hypothetical protein n=1 Tax=Pseudomonas fluorescens TaxID=294 RepID=UPI00099B051D|nr:hypothetical protein [Pseudomonas fluorescens]OPB30805.1 hypothetical protein BFW90_11535 [Pseudomonas fluorescens]
MLNGDQVSLYFKALSKGKPDLASKNTMKFMCRGLKLVLGENKIDASLTIRVAFDMAYSYWVDQAVLVEKLNLVRIDCWGFLDRKERSIHIEDKEDAIARAVLCLLHPDEIGDSDFRQQCFEWFFQMVNKVGDFQPLFDVIFNEMRKKELVHQKADRGGFAP